MLYLKAMLSQKVFSAAKYLLILILLSGASCKRGVNKSKEQSGPIKNIGAAYLSLKYAKGFEVNYFKGYKQIIVKHPWKQSKDPIYYYLAKDSGHIPSSLGKNDILLLEPLDRMAIISTTYLSFIEMLKKEEQVVAISDIKYVYSPKIRALYNQKRIIDIGFDENMNYEKMLQCRTKALFTYGIDQPKDAAKMNSLGIKRIMVSEYLEESPLAQAEWLLFFAAFFNEEERAKIIFDSIDQRYQSLCTLAKGSKDQPIVMCNLPFKGNWYLPGGHSVAAQFIQDAGAHYVFNENKEFGGVNVSFEKALMMAAKADYFLHVNNCKTSQELIASFESMGNLKSFKNKHVFNNNLRSNDQAANDFWESGIANPDLVLKDLLSIFHPNLLPHYSPYYYRRID